MNTRHGLVSLTQWCKKCQNLLLEQRKLTYLNPSRNIFVLSTFCAGHSHYENIRHIKAAKDNARSKSFTGLAKKIEVAIREGGSNDPKRNSDLYQVLKLCKKENMPRATIENLLTKKSDAEDFVYGVSGPGGCSILITCQSTSLTVAKQAVTHSLKTSKFEGQIDPGTLGDFKRKRVILTDMGDAQDMDEDAAMEIALTVGAEEIKVIKEKDRSFLEFVCDRNHYQNVEEAIEASEKNMNIISSKLDYIPVQELELTDSDKASVEIFLSMLHKCDMKSEWNFILRGLSHNINNFKIPF